MFNIQAIIDKKSFADLEYLRAVKKQLPFATARALTNTAKAVLAAEQAELIRSFDRPTQYTRGSLRFSPATKSDLVATVGTKTPAGKNTNPASFLAPEIDGGQSSVKRFERALMGAGLMPKGMRAVPARGVTLDQFGNIPRRLLSAIFRSVKGQIIHGPRELNAKKAKSKGKGNYFAVLHERGNLVQGIWERYYADGVSKAKPVLVFVSEASYKKRLDFYGVAQRTTEAVFESELDRSLEQALATAK